MGVRLRNPNGSYPPQAFTFSDPHTAMRFDDEKADLQTQAERVRVHRQANPEIYKPENAIAFDLEAIKGEIVIQVCSRQPSYCEDEAKPGQPYPPTEKAAKPEPYRQQGKVCAKCGCGEFTPIYCRTCGGQRIQSYKCHACGFDN